MDSYAYEFNAYYFLILQLSRDIHIFDLWGILDLPSSKQDAGLLPFCRFFFLSQGVGGFGVLFVYVAFFFFCSFS